MTPPQSLSRGADHPSYDAFHRDLEKLNATILGLGAVVKWDDGFLSVDESKVPPGLMRTYRELVAYGYANGLLDVANDSDPAMRGAPIDTVTTGGLP